MSNEFDITTPEGRRRWMQACLEHEERRKKEYRSRNPVNMIFHEATVTAFNSAKEAGLHPRINEDGELVYELQQGLRSAHWAREDSAATLILMHTVLQALAVIILLLLVIVWRVW